jgi:RNase P subunit RPR2
MIMDQNGKNPVRIPEGIRSLCPNCLTQVVPKNVVVGWNAGATYTNPLGPTVWITCRGCGKHLKSVSPIYAAQSMEDALKKLEEG